MYIYMYNHVILSWWACGLETDVNAGDNLSLIMRKLAFSISENKDAEQLRSNCAADQRLCFHYIDSTIPLLSKSEIQASSHLLWVYSLVCVSSGRKHRRPVFSRGSFDSLFNVAFQPYG